MYLVSKEKYKENLVVFEKLVNFSHCELYFDGLGDLIKKVSLVNIIQNDWTKSTGSEHVVRRSQKSRSDRSIVKSFDQIDQMTH